MNSSRQPWQCSRCGSRYPNPFCYVCAEPVEDEENKFMKEINQKRLARLAYTLLEEDYFSNSGLVFDMRYFSLNKYRNLCRPFETAGNRVSCCFAGWAVFVFPETRKMSLWTDVVNFIVGDSDENIKRFLFFGVWSNDRSQAAKRALFVLENQSCPPSISYTDEFFPDLSETEVLERLKIYL